MKLLRKRLAWALVAACEWVMLVAALLGDTFSWNVLLFLTGLAAVGAFCDLVLMDAAPEVRERSIPRWLLGAHAVAFVIALAGFGHFWMASFWLAAYALDGARYSKHHPERVS